MGDLGAADRRGPMRVGTVEREQSVSTLGDHFAQGRLDTNEYEVRVVAATSAETFGQLAELFTDLPFPHPAFLAPPLPVAPPSPMGPPPMPYRPGVPAQYGSSDRSKVAAGLLNIFLPFGIGRFYAGNIGIGLAQLLVTLFTFGFGSIWSLIDGILLLANGGYDGNGRRLRD